MFVTIVVVCYTVAFVASSYFLLTWTPAILIARWRGAHVGWWAIVDFGIFQLAIWILSIMTLRSVYYGVQFPPVHGAQDVIRRCLVLGVVTVGSVLRSARWIGAQLDASDAATNAIESLHQGEHRLVEDSPEA